MSTRDLFDSLNRGLRFRRPPPSAPAPDRLHRPSLDEFHRYRRAAVPVRLDGLLEGWSGEAAPFLARLRERFEDREISVIPTRRGRLSSDPDTGVAFETTRFGDYLDRLVGDHPQEAYLVAPGDTWLPEINQDLPTPEYCRSAAWRITRFWLSAPQTSSPLHRDMAENIFFQLVGRKRFFLYPPSASPWLYSNPFRSALPNYSRFDPEEPDYDRFPLARAVQPLEVFLEPGDAIYLPSRWWHQVRSLELSASYNFWFADGGLAAVVRAAEFVKKVRGLEIYGLEAREGDRPKAREA